MTTFHFLSWRDLPARRSMATMTARFSRRDERGLDLARAAMCSASANGNDEAAKYIAARHFGKDSGVVAFLEKGAKPAAYTGDSGGWAEGIALDAGREFIGIVNEVSAFGRCGFRAAPMGVRLVSATTGATGYWVGEARPAPVTAMAFDNGSLKPRQVAALAAVSKELIRLGDPSAERWIRDEMVRAAVAAIDGALFDPDNAGDTDIKPASLLHGVTPIDAGAIADDADIEWLLKALIKDFDGDLESAVWVAKPQTFVSLNSFTRPLVGARGGELLGLPCIASRNLPESENGEILALIDPSGIAAGDANVEVSSSTEGSLEMLDASLVQDATAGTGSTQVSLWQNGLVGLRVTRYVNWAPLRSAVAYAADLALADTSA